MTNRERINQLEAELHLLEQAEEEAKQDNIAKNGFFAMFINMETKKRHAEIIKLLERGRNE